MENYLTSGDLALIENRRGYGYDCGCGCGYGGYHYGSHKGMAATGIGLAAGFGGAALVGLFILGFGLNQASKARARGMENVNNALANNINQLATLAIAERTSRETWQNYHAPSIRNYVDIQSGALAGAGAGAGANSTSNALAQAEAQIVANALTGVSQRCPTPVSLYSAPQPCGCPATNGCCNG